MADEKDLRLGGAGTPEGISDIDDLKARIVEQLTEADVQFPIKNKGQLMDIYPKGTRKSCIYKGREVSIHDLIPLLENSDFPLNSAGDTAAALLSKCELNVATR